MKLLLALVLTCFSFAPGDDAAPKGYLTARWVDVNNVPVEVRTPIYDIVTAVSLHHDAVRLERLRHPPR